METLISRKRSSVLFHKVGTFSWSIEILYSIAIIGFLAFMFCFYCFGSSPLSSSVGFDQGVFQIMAKGWLQGKVPYRDLFDHKGPVLYLINMGGLLISDRYGIFLLEWLNLTASCLMMYLIGRSLTDNKTACWLGLLATGAFFYYYARGGNLTETWTLSLTLIPMTMLFRRFRIRKNVAKVFSPELIFITGICFGLIALIRLNNGILLASIGVTMLICLVKIKNWRLIGKNIIAVIIGFFIPVIPIVLYFASHDALHEFWFAVIGFNLQYGAAHIFPLGIVLRLGLKMLPIALLVVAMIFPCRVLSQPQRLYIMIAGASALLITVPIGSSWHYFIIMAPLVYVMFVLLMSAPIWVPWRIAGLIFALVMFITRTGLIITYHSLFPENNKKAEEKMVSSAVNEVDAFMGEYNDVMPTVEMIKRNVKTTQQDSIFSVNLHAGLLVYYHLRATPLCRHFYAQGWQSDMSSIIASRVREDKAQTKAPWILTVKNRPEKDMIFRSKLKDEYELADSTNYHRLYRRKRMHI